jgi:dihydrofolate reductase
MTRVRVDISISLDGYVAGPDQSLENPIGRGGMRLHEWVFPLRTFRAMSGEDGGETGVNDKALQRAHDGIGAVIMGRHMFGPGRGAWDREWMGWWGPNPPYHAPVFVLTHHPRESLEMEGGTTFHFETDGIAAALGRARDAAGPKSDISLAGGANTIQQYLAAGLVDELTLHVVPVLLGGGERLFDNVGAPGLALEQVRVIEGDGVTHVSYRPLGPTTAKT